MQAGSRPDVSTRQIELRLPSEVGWETLALDLAGSVARKMGFPADRVVDLRTALNEALINAIEHGNAANAAEWLEVVLVSGDECLEIDVHDRSSQPFPADLGSRPPPNIDDIVAGRAPARGWGSFLIRSLVDGVEFDSTGTGNVVRMTMYLSPATTHDRSASGELVGRARPE